MTDVTDTERRVIIVGGGGAGLGTAIARALAQEGVPVLVLAARPHVPETFPACLAEVYRPEHHEAPIHGKVQRHQVPAKMKAMAAKSRR